jgi:bis(5'-nucleosyl)-tetraphosphatase (symmetrical)
VTRYAIGDIQGCMTTLEHLLAAIAFTPSRDELWLAGDLVNRGPRSLDVLRWAKRLGVTTVLGNHDLHLLSRVAGVAHEKKRDTLDEVLAAPDLGELVDWLRAQPLFVHDDRHALVHAGLHPRWTIAHARALATELETGLRGPRWKQYLAQMPEPARANLAYLVRVRTCRLDGRLEPDFDGPPEAAPAGCAPWFALPDPAWATHTIIFGHWAAGGLQLGTHHAGLDTGCVWGRSLTAMRIDDRHIVQVAAAD